MPKPHRALPFKPLLVIVIGLAVLAFAVEGGEYGTLDLLRQRRAQARVTKQIDSLSRVVDSLRQYRDRLLHDPKLQERIAREEFGMVREGELLYRFVEPESSTSRADSGPRARP